MKVYRNLRRKKREKILQRPVFENKSLEKSVRRILKDVQKKGDKAVRKYSREFDGVKLKNFQVSDNEILQAENFLSDELKSAIQLAKNNIEKFHASQWMQEEMIETMPGVLCRRKMVAIEKVGLYIPGGTAPLFSTILMLGIPAKIAGCHEIILASPPAPYGPPKGDKKTGGGVHPAILYTAQLVGITKIFRIGGVQAIGAMAYGTEQVPKVDKIFGPGNQYVTCAKQMVQMEGVAIDMPAGPSEVAVYANGTANPVFVAADLLSQAEHGADSQVLLVTDSSSLADRVQKEIASQLENLPRKKIAEQALQHSKIILVHNEDEAMELLNDYAPEHLILACDHANELAEKVINAGSVFLGHFSPESVGDYASGTNHTLPTNGYAKAYSGVSVDSFVKKITFQQLSEDGLKNIGKAVELMAEAEGLLGHKHAVSLRVKNIQ